MSRKSGISIAMATFNGANYVEQQLESFSRQTVLPDEAIVSDDGSTDSTVSLIKQFAANAPFPIRVLKNPSTLGYAQNFSRALMECRGDFVFLSDQDDYWLPNKIERVLAEFQSDPSIQLVAHDLEFCREDLTPIGQTKIERMEGMFDLDASYVVGMATALRGDWLKICLPIPQDVTHDKWLHRCAAAVGRKRLIRDVLALYRRHRSNATGDGALNVDFVTTPRHFSRSWGDRLSVESAKLTRGAYEAGLFVTWMLEKRPAVLQGRYARAEDFDASFKMWNSLLSSYTVRTNILRLPRWKRAVPIAGLYFQSGYDAFNGWKSAVKDLLMG